MRILNSVFLRCLCRGGPGGLQGGSAEGGAVSVSLSASRATTASIKMDQLILIFNSTFRACSALAGYAYREIVDLGGSRGVGGAVNIFSLLSGFNKATIKGCLFTDNLATTESYGEALGGAMAIVLTTRQTTTWQGVEVIDCSFYNNSVKSGVAHGGALGFMAGNEHGLRIGLGLQRCKFVDNFAQGGFIDMSDVRNVNKPMNDPPNIAEGGAFYAQQDFSVMTISIKDSIFSNNSVRSTAWNDLTPSLRAIGVGHGRGGAISLYQFLLELTDVKFLNNSVLCVTGTVVCGGGAIFSGGPTGGGTVQVRSSLFDGNKVSSRISDFSFNQTVINDGEEFTSSAVCGGAIQYTRTMHISDSVFSNNEARGSAAYGGALCIDSPFSATTIFGLFFMDLSIGDSNFTHNSAVSHAGPAKGGAIYAVRRAKRTFSDPFFLTFLSPTGAPRHEQGNGSSV